MNTEGDGRTVRGLINALNDRDWDRIRDSYRADIIMEHPAYPDPVVGSRQVLEYLKKLIGDFPDLHVEIANMFGDRGWVCVESDITSTFRGAPLQYPECVVLRVEDGQIARERHYVDLLVFQRGSSPTPTR